MKTKTDVQIVDDLQGKMTLCINNVVKLNDGDWVSAILFVLPDYSVAG